jgi:UDP-glucuronate 4-epimerase
MVCPTASTRLYNADVHVLITGGAGFIGSHLAEALLRRGDKVTVLDNFDPYYDPRIKWANVAAAEEYKTYGLVEGDVRDAGAVENLLQRTRPDAIVHLAALAGVRESLREPLAFNDVNVNGTVVMFEAARSLGTPRFIFASTSSVYGDSPRLPHREDDPLQHCASPYGATKIAGEQYGHIYHQVHGLPVVSLRFFTAYGPRQRPDMAIHRFARAILDGSPLPLYGDGSTSRDYTYIDDIVQGVQLALDSTLPTGVFNLGGGHRLGLLELVRLLEQACGKTAQIEWLPTQPGDPPHTWADVSAARQQLGYAPRTEPAEGIAKFVAWLRAQS